MSVRLPLLTMLLLAALGCADTAEAAPLPGFRPGESFIFQFSIGSIQAGRARLSVGRPARTTGGTRVALQGDAETNEWLAVLTRVRDLYHSVLDADGPPATRTVKIEEHGLRERSIDIVLDRHPRGTLIHLDVTRPTERRKEQHQIEATPFDLVAAMFLVRFQALDLGDSFEFVFFDGPSFYRAEARVLRREGLMRSGRQRAAVRVDINAVRVDWALRPLREKPERRHAAMLLSDDAEHVPYRIEGDTDFGRCTLDLVAYQPGGPPVPSLGSRTTATRPAEVVLRPGRLPSR